MDENLSIPADTLSRIRGLNDADLMRLIVEISDYGWAKAEPLLRMLADAQERRQVK